MTASTMTSIADSRPTDFPEHDLTPADLAEIDLREEDFGAESGGTASLAEGSVPSGNDCELSSDPASDLWLYRDRTVGMLRRYMRLAIEVGRLPSLLGREFFRTRVTSYHASTFEDAVIFVHDVERSLEILDEFDKKLIAKIVLQEYSQEEAGRLLGCGLRTAARRYAEALDRISEVFLKREILARLPATKREAPETCQEGKMEENPASDSEQTKNNRDYAFHAREMLQSMDMASRRVRELLFEFGLIMAAIVLSKVFDFALGYVAASILAIAFVFQWVIQREEGEREVELQGIFGGPIPWAEIKEPPVRPQINWWTWSFPELEYDHKTGTWVEYGGSGGHKAKGCVIHVTNNVDDQKGKGQQARVRAQISWTYDNGSIGPQFSPAPWIGEELGQIELPVGVMKKLLVAIRSFDGNYWSGHGNTRLDRNHHIQAHSDMLPFSGSMIIRLIDSTDVLIAQQKWSWKEDPYVHWPMIKPL